MRQSKAQTGVAGQLRRQQRGPRCRGTNGKQKLVIVKRALQPAIREGTGKACHMECLVATRHFNAVLTRHHFRVDHTTPEIN